MKLLILMLLLSICGCRSVQHAGGWDGPGVTVAVSEGGGSVTMQAPTGGWALTVDRSAVANGVATIWITASRPTSAVTQALTDVTVHWRAPLSRRVECIEAAVRIDDSFYELAAEGCL